MTLNSTHVGKEFLDGGFEIVVKWIEEDLRAGQKSLEEMHKFYDMYTFGSEKKKLTEEEFFIAYKSAELVYQDDVAFRKQKKASQMFRRQ